MVIYSGNEKPPAISLGIGTLSSVSVWNPIEFAPSVDSPYPIQPLYVITFSFSSIKTLTQWLVLSTMYRLFSD